MRIFPFKKCHDLSTVGAQMEQAEAQVAGRKGCLTTDCLVCGTPEA